MKKPNTPPFLMPPIAKADVVNLVADGAVHMEESAKPDSAFVKVLKALPNGDTESVWGRQRNDGKIIIDNLPYFISEFGYQDIVTATPIGTVNSSAGIVQKFQFVDCVKKQKRRRFQAVAESDLSQEQRGYLKKTCVRLSSDIHLEWGMDHFLVFDIPDKESLHSKMREAFRNLYGIILLHGHPLSMTDVDRMKQDGMSRVLSDLGIKIAEEYIN